MKLYQIPGGEVTACVREIGDIDDGWQINTGDAPAYTALVEVVLRDGAKDTTPTLASKYRWSIDPSPTDIVAYRIIQPKLQLSLEIGGIYRSRDGEIHGPLVARTDHPLYPVKTPGGRSWTRDGHYYDHVSIHSHDLVEHIATAPGDGWVAHNKNGIPDLPVDSVVEVVTRSGKVQLGGRFKHDWSWAGTGSTAPILAYRVVSVPKLQLEVGGIYRSRSGEIHGPLKAHAHSIYKFASDYETWTADGRYIVSGPDELDLVEHIATVPGEGWIAWNEPHSPFTYENPVLEVVTRQGNLPAPRPARDWNWGASEAPLIRAYRVVHPTPKVQLTLEERVARLEAHLA